MAGRITYRYTDLLRNDDVLASPAVLSEQAKTGIEGLIKRSMTENEMTIVLRTVLRLEMLKRAELSIKKSEKYVTSQDIQRTLRSFAKLTPGEAFPAYQNSGEIIQSMIDQVSRMELGINIHGGNDQLLVSLGLSLHPDDYHDIESMQSSYINALGGSVKNAAAIALRYYPYSPLNPCPDPDEERTGHPIRRKGQPVKRYREKLASYSLNLWAELGMEPCEAWQHQDYDPNASEIVRFMLALSVAINDYSLLSDLKEAVRLLKEAEEWVVHGHPQNEVS